MGQQVNVWCEQCTSLELRVALHTAQIKQLWYNNVVSKIRPEA